MSLDQVISHLKAKRNVFITGPGGTGKSYIVRGLLEKYPHNFSITSTTGISAYNLSDLAKTIHSFSGTNVSEFQLEYYHDNNPKDIDEEIELSLQQTMWQISEKTEKAIKACGALIIEEVSMLSAYKMDFISEIFKRIKKDQRPFGGMRLVILGDFLQLESVFQDNQEPMLAFESKVWTELNLANVVLTEIKRTENLDFAKMLCDLRLGQITDEDFFRLKNTSKNVFDKEPVRLVAMNKKAEEINNAELAKLPGTEEVFKARWNGDKEYLKELRESILAKDVLKLKPESRVMIVVNDRDDAMNTGLSYFNGSLGTYKGIVHRETVRKVWQSERDKTTGVILRRFLDYRVYEAMEILLDTGYTVYLKRKKWEYGERFTNKEGVLQAEAEYSQYPVVLAHAITIHKSQGLTIPLLEIDCKGIFADNQLYVAVSRGISFDAIRVLNLKSAHLKTSEKALEFYRKLGEENGKLHE